MSRHLAGIRPRLRPRGLGPHRRSHGQGAYGGANRHEADSYVALQLVGLRVTKHVGGPACDKQGNPGHWRSEIIVSFPVKLSTVKTLPQSDRPSRGMQLPSLTVQHLDEARVSPTPATLLDMNQPRQQQTLRAACRSRKTHSFLTLLPDQIPYWAYALMILGTANRFTRYVDERTSAIVLLIIAICGYLHYVVSSSAQTLACSTAAFGERLSTLITNSCWRAADTTHSAPTHTCAQEEI